MVLGFEEGREERTFDDWGKDKGRVSSSGLTNEQVRGAEGKSGFLC